MPAYTVHKLVQCSVCTNTDFHAEYFVMFFFIKTIALFDNNV